MRDRRRYLHWVFEAKKRFGVSVLNYMVTSNHIHLLGRDTGPEVIAQSMQLIAGHTAQEYNQRKNRQGAFWRGQKGQVFLLLVSRVGMGSFYSSH
jgi:REP element-mobilizing transposase RayT